MVRGIHFIFLNYITSSPNIMEQKAFVCQSLEGLTSLLDEGFERTGLRSWKGFSSSGASAQPAGCCCLDLGVQWCKPSGEAPLRLSAQLGQRRHHFSFGRFTGSLET